MAPLSRSELFILLADNYGRLLSPPCTRDVVAGLLGLSPKDEDVMLRVCSLFERFKLEYTQRAHEQTKRSA